MIPIDRKDLHFVSIQVDPWKTVTDRQDVATAATAVRNLNGYDIGTRQLRVDFSEKEGTRSGNTTSSDVFSVFGTVTHCLAARDEFVTTITRREATAGRCQYSKCDISDVTSVSTSTISKYNISIESSGHE